MADDSELPTLAPEPPNREAAGINLEASGENREQRTVSRSVPSAADSSIGTALPCDQEPATRPFGDYELLGEIARGGMGVVYRARERHSGRLVALKMMLGAESSDATERGRFILEARATGELSHPGIVAIHAWSE